MPFLAVTTFLLYANFIAAIRCLRRGGEYARLLGAGHLVAVMAGLMGFLFGIELFVFDHDGGIAGNDYNWTPVFYAIFGLLSLVLFGYKFAQKTRRKDAAPILGFVFGMVIWAGLSGLYVFGATLDHFIFFDDPRNTGQMEVGFSGEKLTCTGGMILVRIEAGTAVFRCPLSVRLGRDYLEPFVPWPSYTEGSSERLKAVTDSIQDEMKHHPNVVAVPSADIKVMPNASGADE